MRTIVKTAKPVKMTVGSLISELCRWPDHAEVTFRGQGPHEELSFCRVVGRTKKHVDIELTSAPESLPVVPT